MIDIHSHILPNVDDGPKSKEETFKILKEAYNAGITEIILTSHYIEDKYFLTKRRREVLVNNLQKELNEKYIPIRLYVGAEAYISIDLPKKILDGIVPTLANSRYILFELPMNSKVIYLEQTIERLLGMNLIPVLAHPERYSYVQEDIWSLYDLLDKGMLLQCNYASISGIYGKQAKKTLKKLLKANMVHFLASDVHRSDSIYTKTDKMLKKVERIIGKRKMDILTQVNPNKIIRNESIK